MSRVRADKYTNSAANGAPEFTHGVIVTGNANVSGVITATSFSGDGSGLSGVSAGISSAKAYTFNQLFS